MAKTPATTAFVALFGLLSAACALGADSTWLDLRPLRSALLAAAGGESRKDGAVEIGLPWVDGSVRRFALRRETDTMSPELAAKYPGIVPLVGVEVGAPGSQEARIAAIVTFSQALGLQAELASQEHGVVILEPMQRVPPPGSNDVVEMRFRTSNKPGKTTGQQRKNATQQCSSSGGGGGTIAADPALSKNGAGSQASAACPGAARIGDLRCDPDLNTAACAYDAGDCCSVYALCGATDPSACRCIDPARLEVPHRRYRIALGCTTSYAAAFGSSMERIVASFVALLQRINGLYMRELSVSFQLIGATDRLIDLDGFLMDNVGGAGQFPDFLRARGVRDDAYDLGHLLGNFDNGISYMLGSVCNDDYKAAAATGALFFSDPEWLVAHEIAHQMGADHSWSACDGTEGLGSEAGSGTSIMGYGGTCGDDNVDEDRDALFHSYSLAQLQSCLLNPNKCGKCATLVTEDQVLELPAQTLDLDADDCRSERQSVCTVPKSTPFRLAARRTPDSGNLFYSWEQCDRRTVDRFGSLLAPQDANAALFASPFPRRDVLSRTFPSIDKVRRGMDLVDTRERLPNLARDMHFTLLARTSYLPAPGFNWFGLAGADPQPTWDGQPVPRLGAVSTPEPVVVKVVGEQPLRVANISGPVTPGGRLEVAWTGATQSADRVRILLSLDDGETFPILLAADVSNAAGAATVAVPQLPACGLGFARVRVESLTELEGCSFFAMNDGALAIDGCGTASTTPPPVPNWPIVDLPEPIVPLQVGPAPGRFDHAGRVGADAVADGYANEALQTIVVLASGSERPALRILELDTEENYDFVTITDGASGAVLARLSGAPDDLPREFVGSGQRLEVVFSSDRSGTGNGMIAEHYSVPAPSRRRTQADIAQPQSFTLWRSGEPSEVAKRFQVPRGSRVQLTVVAMVAAAGVVTVRDGDDGSLLHVFKATDDVLPFPVLSRGRSLQIEARELRSPGRLQVLLAPVADACASSTTVEQVDELDQPGNAVTDPDHTLRLALLCSAGAALAALVTGVAISTSKRRQREQQHVVLASPEQQL